ncbi:MAG: glycosyltransferase family 2 protein [Rhodospirillaceae bacterium]
MSSLAPSDATRRPLVSVVIPAFNCEDTIARALASVQQQEYDPLEIIVVDDGSTDRTREVVENLRLPDLTLIQRKQRGGASAARNAGIFAARGEYVAFLDADDEWLPGKIAKQLALIEHDDMMTFVTNPPEWVSASGQKMGILGKERPPAEGPDAWKTLLAHTFVATPCVLARRSDLIALNGFDCTLKVAEDQDMWIRLALRGPVGYLNEVLVRVHERPGSLSAGNPTDEIRYTLPMILKHFESNRHRLSRGERRRILGERMTSAGRKLYRHGLYTLGLRHILRAIALRYKPFENLLYLVTSLGFHRRLRQAFLPR